MGEQAKYSYIDIRRYLNNEMTPAEMHAFEKAMLDDPFLSDAMEGFRASDPDLATRHLQEIEERLLSPRSSGKIIPMAARQRTRWWQVAALILVIVTTALLVRPIFRSGTPAKEFAAEVKQASSADTIRPAGEPPIPRPTPNDRGFIARQPSTPSIKKRIPSEPPQNTRLQASEKEMSAPVAATADSEMATPREAMSVALQKTALPAPAASLPLREFRGKVIDSVGQPVAYATIQAENKVTTASDQHGNFSIMAADTSLKVVVSSVGFSLVQKNLAESTANQIVLPKYNPGLSEVVVVGYGGSKRRQSTPEAIRRVTEKTRGPVNGEPDGGWADFRDYAVRQLTGNQQATSTGLLGVSAEFELNPEGRPINITVTTTNKDYSLKLVKALESGPRWRFTVQSNVKISFML